MSSAIYVTLVAVGGTPVRLANLDGSPLPTTGSGALVFANGPVLNNATLNGFTLSPPVGTTAGSQASPAFFFATTDRGFFSQGTNDISIAIQNNLVASFQLQRSSFYYTATGLSLKTFSDTVGEVGISGRNLADSVGEILALNKYAGNVTLGAGLTPNSGHSASDGNLKVFGTANLAYLDTLVAGGTANHALLFGTTAFGLYASSGAPTLSAPQGSVAASTSGAPYFNNNGTTGWTQLATSVSPTLTGPVTVTPGGITVTGGSIAVSTPGLAITQTWNAAGQSFTALLVNVTATAETDPSYLIRLQVAAADRFTVDRFGSTVALLNGSYGGNLKIESATAVTAGGAQDFGLLVSTTPNFGNFYGSGAPTSSQNRGSTYQRTDAGSMYINTSAGLGTTWDQVVSLAAAQSLTGKTYNGLTVTTSTGTLTIGSGTLTLAGAKSFTVNNTMTLTGTDGSSLSIGAGGQVFTKVNVQVFVATGTYTPTAGMVYCTIECWGAGGGGGGAANSGATAVVTAAGGGSGGYSRFTATAAAIGASKAVTIGTAGTAGTAGNNAGGAGGDTSVGVLCVGKGGSGGAGSAGTTASYSAGGAGGVSGTGDILGLGATGGSGAGSTAIFNGGGGGSSSVGGGGVGGNVNSVSTGAAATGHGAGGGGGTSAGAGGAAAGGAGTAGYVVITEYYS